MLSQLIRGLHRQTFKSLQTQNYVKRFYSNQELNQKTVTSEDKDKDEEQLENFRFHNKDWESEDTSRVYEEYYRRYYDTKFDNKSSGRQTDGNEDNGYKRKNNERFKSNSYSFSDCKYHLLTLRLLEKVGYIVSIDINYFFCLYLDLILS